jgi:asparagine synthase (glutamine-hydrolysing)
MNGIVKRFASLIVDGALVRQGLIDPDQARGGLSGFDLPFLYKLVLLECWVRLHLEGQAVDTLLAKKANALW